MSEIMWVRNLETTQLVGFGSGTLEFHQDPFGSLVNLVWATLIDKKYAYKLERNSSPSNSAKGYTSLVLQLGWKCFQTQQGDEHPEFQQTEGWGRTIQSLRAVCDTLARSCGREEEEEEKDQRNKERKKGRRERGKRESEALPWIILRQNEKGWACNFEGPLDVTWGNSGCSKNSKTQ